MDSNPDTFDRGEGEKTFFGGPLFLGDLGKPHDLSLVVYDSAVSVSAGSAFYLCLKT